ncbi:MAG: 4-(cytidine 5'-diphospho)-2-C-methyl-D-erythritol kinase [Paracoccaceae bacterium]
MNEARHRREFARCKVNLTLHVTGRRDDGYHLLDSLVVFPDIGDVVEVAPSAALTLEVRGKFADALGGAGNLVLRAAALCDAQGRGAALRLTKNLPVASGIGGGSADAAATVRLLCRYWKLDPPAPEALLSLGADVPVCLDGRAARMRGIGECLEPVAGLPRFWLVLANCGAPVATAEVFVAPRRRFGEAMPAALPDLRDLDGLVRFLGRQRNDLEAAAVRLCGGIGDVLEAMRATDDCRLARMSGSGGTCFGVFGTEAQARAARGRLRAMHPEWWVEAGPVNPP